MVFFFLALRIDGRFVVFESRADNLIGNNRSSSDQNTAIDIFVRDTLLQETFRVSISNNTGQEGDGDSTNGVITACGTKVVFLSAATNLVENEPLATPGIIHVYVRDLVKKTTSRLSVSNAGVQANANSMRPHIDASGSFVVFDSSASNLIVGQVVAVNSVYLYDIVHSNLSLLTPSINKTLFASDGNSDTAFVAPMGAFVVYASSKLENEREIQERERERERFKRER